LECNFTKTRLALIFSNVIDNIPSGLDSRTVSADLDANHSNQYQHIIKGLVPKTWTNSPTREHSSSTTQRKAAAALTNTIIEQFRQTIWNPWCKMRKRWEKTHHHTPTSQSSQHNNNTTTSQPIISTHTDHYTLIMSIMEGYIKPPVIVYSPPPTNSPIIVPPASSSD